MNVQAASILLLLLNIFFFPFIWANKTLLLSARGAPSILSGGAVSDAPPLKLARTADPAGPAWQFEPSLKVIRRAYLDEKTFPLWSPYSGYGAPLAAAMHLQPFHPLTILLSLHPTPTTVALFLLTRLLIAGFFSYLFLRLFVPHLPALAAGVAYMFTGYFILYLNMFHITVEMMLPAVFYSFELLHRRFDARSIILCSAMVCFSIIGGAPESLFLLLVFGYLYFFYRIATDAAHGVGFLKKIGRLALVNIIGFGGAALLLLPFLEYLSRSFNVHAGPFAPGLDFIIHRRDLLGYLVPLVEGQPRGGNGVYGYFGMTTTMLAVLAVATWIREWRSRRATAAAALVPFFAVAIALMILKRYGIWPAQWIGRLPFFRMITLYKYLEPLIGFGMAVLCGIGLSHIMGKKLHAKTAAAAIGIVLAMFLIGYAAFLPDAATQSNAWIFFESTTTGLVALLVVAAIVLAAAGHRPEGTSAASAHDKKSFVGPALLACLTGELLLIFIYPMFYKYSEQPDKSVNAFSGSSYISWLQQKDARTFRIFARNGILTPNWPGVFRLSDIRNVDAMYAKKYLPFVRAFFTPQVPGQDLFDRFTGMNFDYSFTSPSARRLLQLSSVRYIITDAPFAGGKSGDLGIGDPAFKLVYNREVQIYEYPAILPRAAVFYGVETALTDEDSLKRLLDPEHDVFQRAVVALPSISSESARKIDEMNAAPPRRATAADIVRQESREVDIEAKLDQPGLLTLNDTDFPGWRADVDGKEVPILNVNYLFRGVLLETGSHQVRFRYQPASFRWGAAVSVLSLMALLIAARFPQRLRLG